MPLTANFPALTGAQALDTSAAIGGFPGISTSTVDWDGHRTFVISLATSKIVQIDNYTCAVLAGPTVITGNIFGFGQKYASNGFLYGIGPGGANAARLNKIDPAAMNTVLSFFGNATSGFQFSTTATTWAVPSDWDEVVAGSAHFLISVTANFSQTNNELTFLNMDVPGWTGQNYNLDAINMICCGGLNDGTHGAAFAAACNDGNGTSAGLWFYAFQIDAAGLSSQTLRVNIPAATVDPAWTHLSAVAGMTCDETDGNPILLLVSNALNAWSAGSYGAGQGFSNAGHDFVSLIPTSLAPTIGGNAGWLDLGPHQAASGVDLAKINAATGAMMWRVPVLGAPSVGGNGNMANSRVRFGLYLFYDPVANGTGGHWMHQILTATGADVKANVLNTTVDGQYSNSEVGQIIFTGVDGGGAGAPVNVNPAHVGPIITLGSATPPFQPASKPPSAKRHHNQILDYFTTPSAHL